MPVSMLPSWGTTCVTGVCVSPPARRPTARREMNLITVLSLLSVLLLASLAPLARGQSSTGAASSLFDLNLVFSTDVRGRMLPITSTQADCAPSTVASSPATCFGGVARRATFIKAQKAAYANTLVVDLGNYYFGSTFVEVASPQASNIALWVSQSKYDVVGLGTNDFFSGPGLLADYMSSFSSTNPSVVCTNLDVSSEPLLSGVTINSYRVQTVNGRKIGFIGAISDQLAVISSPGANVKVNSGGTVEELLTNAITALQTANPDCNIIVLLTTATTTDVTNIINEVNGIDVVLYKSESAADPVYATEVVSGRTLVKATIPLTGGVAAFGGTMGALQISFDADGEVQASSINASTTAITSTYTEDTTIWSASTTGVQFYYLRVQALNSVVFGQVTEYLGEATITASDPLIWCRASDCNLGRLVTDAMLSWCADCDLAHTNGGGLRANLKASAAEPNVTRGDIAAILPYQNTFTWYKIQGKDFVSSVLTYSLQKYALGGWQQYSNVRWAYNPSTKTISTVTVRDRTTGLWSAIVSTKTYKIATLNYVLAGGDGYDIGPTLGVDLYGPDAVEQIGAWIGADDFVQPPSIDQLQVCGINISYTLTDVSGDGTNITWPYSQCNVLQTSGTRNLADECPTNYDFCNAGIEVYDGKMFNKSNCDTCSGLGTCITGYRVCACDAATSSGLFAGISMIEGSSCSTIRTEYAVNDGLVGVLYFLCGVALLVSFGASLFFFLYRNTKVIKRSASLFLQLTCLGGALGAACAICTLLPTSDATCQLSTWLGNLGWILMFGSLFVKTWRIYRIFGNKRLKTVVLRDRDMLLRLAAILATEILLRSIESGIAPPQKSATTIGSDHTTGETLQDLISGTTSAVSSNFYYYFTCDASHHSVFEGVSYGWKGALTLWGCMLAFFIRNIEENFNESKLLALVIYNMTLFAVIARGIIAFLGNTSPSLTLAIEVLAICYVVICTVLILSVPKYLLIRHGTGGADQQHQSVSPHPVDTLKGARRSGAAFDHHSDGSTDTDGSGMPLVPMGRITPATFSKTLDLIRHRVRGLTAGERAADLPGLIEQTSRFLDQLNMLRASGGTTSGGTSSGGIPSKHLSPNAARNNNTSRGGAGVHTRMASASMSRAPSSIVTPLSHDWSPGGVKITAIHDRSPVMQGRTIARAPSPIPGEGGSLPGEMPPCETTTDACPTTTSPQATTRSTVDHEAGTSQDETKKLLVSQTKEGQQ